MKNFYAYIVKNEDGKILDPTFVIGQLKPVILLEIDEAFNKTIFEFLKLLHETADDAELSINWYTHACEINEQVPANNK